MAAIDLVPLGDVTHTWSSGAWPSGADASSRVRVPDGSSVSFDVVGACEWLRIDGEVTFADAAPQLTTEYILVTMTGRLEIGTPASPITTSAGIIFEDSADIDLVSDPEMVGRGLVNMGVVDIHGAPVTTWDFVSVDPMATDITVTLANAPTGWAIGDQIVIAGTNRPGWNPANTIYTESEDEERTIAGIAGNVITLNAALVHDHDTPRADFKTIVTHHTRSVTFRSASGSVWHRRGHTMTMAPTWDSRYAAFDFLGRTNKEVLSKLPSDRIGDPVTESRKGRYALHCHHTDMTVIGCSVWDAPGWSITHHDGHATITDCVCYKYQGAGIVAEAGSETGVWARNACVNGRGLTFGDPKNAHSITTDFDLGISGDGFWMQGRLLEIEDNVCASSNTGFVFFHRGFEGEEMMKNSPASVFGFPNAMHYDPDVKITEFPIRHFARNIAFACRGGGQIVKSGPDQHHDVHTHMDTFTAWNINEGFDFTYTSHYTLVDFTCFCKPGAPHGSRGISLAKNTTDFTILNPVIDGFREGIDAIKTLTSGFVAPNGFAFLIVNPTLTNMTEADYVNIEPGEIITTLPGGTLSAALDPMEHTGGGIALTGTKTDSAGTQPLPVGTDDYDLEFPDVLRILEEHGYYQDEQGANVFPFHFSYTDRVTGAVRTDVIWIPINPSVNLGHPVYSNVQDMGPKPQPGQALETGLLGFTGHDLIPNTQQVLGAGQIGFTGHNITPGTHLASGVIGFTGYPLSLTDARKSSTRLGVSVGL